MTAQHRLKAQHRFGLNLSWPWLAAVFLIDAAVLVTGSQLPDPRVALGVAGLVAIVSLITYRGISPIAALTARAWDSPATPEATLVAGSIPAIGHHRRFGRHAVGVPEYQGSWSRSAGIHGDQGSRLHGANSPTTQP